MIPNAVGPPFEPEGEAAAGDYVLAVSTLEPRKNLPASWTASAVRGMNGSPPARGRMSGWGDVQVDGQ